MIGVVTTQRPPLAALVKDKHDQGVSYREMSEAARKAGHQLSHSQLQAYATDSVRKAPSSEQMEALAAAIGIPFERVRAAMIEQYYGYVPKDLARTDTGPLAAAVPPDLTDDEAAELRRMVEAWVAARRADR